MAKLVLLAGKSGSGKSTAAGILETEFGFTEFAFAHPLKEIARIFGFNNVYGTQEEKLQINELWGISDREFLQKFGTEICKKELPKLFPTMANVWSRLMEGTIKNNQDKRIVISDCRSPDDEIPMAKKYGGFIIKLIRPCVENEEKKSKTSTHETETSIDKIEADEVIYNDGTIEELTVKLQNALEKFELLKSLTADA